MLGLVCEVVLELKPLEPPLLGFGFVLPVAGLFKLSAPFCPLCPLFVPVLLGTKFEPPWLP